MSQQNRRALGTESNDNGGIRPRSIAGYPIDTPALLADNKVDWHVSPEQSALLIHDMQQYWVDPFEDRGFVDHIAALANAARQNDVPVFYSGARVAVSDVDRGVANDLFGPGIGRTNDATVGDTEIITELNPEPGDIVLNKPRYSAFFDTNLAVELRERGVVDLIICGVFAHHGCMITAVDAYMHGFRVFFVVDAMGDHDQATHELAASYVAETSGMICLTEKVVTQLGAAR